MKCCLKWENVEIIGFKVYKWNEKLMRNNISDDNAIFVFRSHPDKGIKRIFQVKLRSLLEPLPSNSTGNFRSCVKSSAFSEVLFRSGLFWMKSPEDQQVARTLVNYTRSSFKFSRSTVNCPFAPRLVFVLDFLYTPRIHIDCPSNLLDILFSAIPVPLCSNPHHIPGSRFSNEDEEEALRAAPAYDSDQSKDDEVDSDEASHERDPNDPENMYSEETKELVTRLRRYRNVGRTFPLRSRSSMDPVGLVEVDRPMMWALVSQIDDCKLCKGKMEAGDAVFQMNCEHIFHRDCAMPMIFGLKTCPLCREPIVRKI